MSLSFVAVIKNDNMMIMIIIMMIMMMIIITIITIMTIIIIIFGFDYFILNMQIKK